MFTYLIAVNTSEDRDKFKEIYMIYRDRMYHAAYAIIKNEMDAENIVHDTFVKLIDNLDKINEVDCHMTWNYIVTIVKNLSFNFLKRENRYGKVVFEDYMEGDAEMHEGVESAILRRGLEEELAKAVTGLQYPHKEVLYLQYYNGLSSKEIAVILGIKPENVRKISQRAKKKLEQALLEGGFCYE